MKTITSVHNEEVKSVAKLASTKERSIQGKYIAEGLRTCQTLLECDAQLVKLYITDEHEGVALSLTSEDLITIVDSSVMAKMSQSTSPSGFLGVFKLPATPDVKKLTAGMVLARIADPGNMGTLIRSCAAFGAESVVVVEGCDPWSPKVVQATVGTIASVQIFQWSWQELLANSQNIKLAALVVTGGKSPQEIDLAKSLLVVGSETQGIPHEWLKDCEQKITIAMPGKTESLNAGVAGSIALYAATLK